METKAKRFVGMLVGLVFCLATLVPVWAAGTGAVWATVQGQQAVVYLQGADPAAEFACQIGSTPVTPATVQPIDALDTPIHTVILVDNSVSIPSAERPLVQEILEAVAGNRLPGEQFSAATISQTVNWLCEAQTDYLQVKAALDGITYNDQETRLTDCLYAVLEHLQQQYPGQFCRLILVSDGVDNQQIGYTREELDTLIRETGYPLYAIGCTNTGANGNERLQELFALARLTSGASFYLGETQDANAIAAGIAGWNTGAQLVFDLPLELCDGAARQMQVVSGETTYAFSLTMPFGLASEVPTTTPEPAAPTASPAPPPAPAEAQGLAPEILIAVCGGVAVIAVVVLVLVLRKRRKPAPFAEPNAAPIPAAQAPTELVAPASSVDRATQTPWGEAATQTIHVRITDINNPLHAFKNPLQVGCPLLVGRDPARCQVLLDYEPSVSRVQCELSLRGEEVWLRNLSQANITQVNGQRIEGECRLNSGSTLKIGRLMLKVEYQQ